MPFIFQKEIKWTTHHGIGGGIETHVKYPVKNPVAYYHSKALVLYTRIQFPLQQVAYPCLLGVVPGETYFDSSTT